MAGRSRPGLKQAGFRVSGDYRAEKVGSKIRDAQLELVPYMFVLGGRRPKPGQVALRDRLGGRSWHDAAGGGHRTP